MILHGAGPRGFSRPFEQICAGLAEQGYLAMFVEYYSQTGTVRAGQRDAMREYFPVWISEIRAGIANLRARPDVAPQKIGLLGYSLGAFLALTTGATAGKQIAAVVEYYGGLPSRLQAAVGQMPPTLILHGDADQLVPVSQAMQLGKLLKESHRPYEMHIYPDAAHAFNFQIPGWYDQASGDDAWKRTLAFLSKYLKGRQ